MKVYVYYQMNPIIQIKGLKKSYGKQQVLNHIDLEVEAGQIIGYIGPNGAGKSTTVRILIGLDGDFEGEVFLNGIDVRKDPLAIKRIVGYIPEVAEIYDVLTPMEYLELVGKLHGMSSTQIEERATSMLGHFGLVDHLDKRMDTFSKGMRQKVLIVSGLIHNPQIIFMDEPLTGLDANTVIMVKEIIAKLSEEGKTIFYSSHMMDIVEKVSHRIILINQGQIIADGSFEDLQKQSGESLEHVFAQLTGEKDHGNKADDFLNTFNE